MTKPGIERRRTPRVSVQECRLGVLSRFRVRVLDISVDGVSMASEVLPDETAVLRLSLPGIAFEAGLRICHQETSAERGIVTGAAFTGVSAESRRVLERFLMQATPAKHRVQES